MNSNSKAVLRDSWSQVQHLICAQQRYQVPGKTVGGSFARGPFLSYRVRFKIYDSVTAIIVTAKVFVCLVSSALAVNHNRLLFSILLHNVAQLFALLQFKVIKGVGHLVATTTLSTVSCYR
jgi:hypothetical protein